MLTGENYPIQTQPIVFYFEYTRKVKVLSLPETIKEKIDVSSEGPSSGVNSKESEKTTRVFLYELIQKHHVTNKRD